jgi:hypothetical protein
MPDRRPKGVGHSRNRYGFRCAPARESGRAVLLGGRLMPVVEMAVIRIPYVKVYTDRHGRVRAISESRAARLSRFLACQGPPSSWRHIKRPLESLHSDRIRGLRELLAPSSATTSKARPSRISSRNPSGCTRAFSAGSVQSTGTGWSTTCRALRVRLIKT